MDEYQHSDDEFELMYANFNDECYLIREMHNDLEDSLSFDPDPLFEDDYPNSDEEFEVRYDNELEVLQGTEGSRYSNDCLLDELFNKVSLANQLTQLSDNVEVKDNLDHNSNLSEALGEHEDSRSNTKELNSCEQEDKSTTLYRVEIQQPNNAVIEEHNKRSVTVKRPLEDMDGYPNAKRTFN